MMIGRFDANSPGMQDGIPGLCPPESGVPTPAGTNILANLGRKRPAQEDYVLRYRARPPSVPSLAGPPVIRANCLGLSE